MFFLLFLWIDESLVGCFIFFFCEELVVDVFIWFLVGFGFK